MHHSRQLAAIMFTDIVGYTALMGNDEHKAFELLSKNRQIQIPIIEEFNGEFIKELGDGILAIFPTASDSLLAAMKIQRDCSASKELSLRIGIHEGETTFENNDVFGDAVNIASRIQTLGIPGSILFSKKIADEVKNKTEFNTVSLGSFEFRNVSEPIEVFALANEGLPVPKRSMMDGKLKKRSGRKILVVAALLVAVIVVVSLTFFKHADAIEKSIAVLPFVDMSAGKDQEYFSDGLSEELLNLLTKIPELKVIGRTSSFSFKGKNEDLRSIAHKLGVTHVLEGSVRKDGKRIRVTAQLIRATDGSHLLSETYDRDLEGIFELQDDIAGAVVKQLKLKLLAPATNTASSSNNTEAYNLILQGNYFVEKRDKESLAKALDFYLKALAIDSLNARSWTALATFYLLQTSWGLMDKNLAIQKAMDYATKSIELDDAQADIHSIMGQIKFFGNFDWPGAEADIQKALNLQPGNADFLRAMGMLYRCTGRYDEGITITKRSLTLDPVKPIAYFHYGHLLMYDNQLDDAIDAFKKTLELNPRFPRVHIFLGIAYLLQGKNNQALAEMQLEEIEAWRSLGLILTYHQLGRKEEVDKMVNDYIDKFQKDEPYQIAQIFAFRGDKDKAFEWLEKSFAVQYVRLNFFKGDPLLKILEGDPRYRVFLKKMNLPVD